MADQQNHRKEALLAAARERLTKAQMAQDSDTAPAANADRQIRYRGKVVRPSNGAVPAATFAKQQPATAATSDDMRAALHEVKSMYRDGLISRAEAETKRSEITGQQ